MNIIQNLLMMLIILSLVVVALSEQPLLCDGNRFKYISSYVLSRQTDLTNTFNLLEPTVHVDSVSYKDQVFRTYVIEPLQITYTYMEAKQNASFEGINLLKVSGGTLRISYEFKWEKKQLTSSINGTGKGSVTTDPITFKKALQINDNRELQWNLTYSQPLVISNSLSLNDFQPYKLPDYEIINKMLNKLPNDETTVKMNLIKAINKDYVDVLRKVVHENNDTHKQEKYVEYIYTDQRGELIVEYDNILQNVSFYYNGLQLLLSQTIQKYPDFECGDKVPSVADNETIYGGIQEFTSNSFLKSTLKYAIGEGFLDVVMTEENWQSPAFQFFVGDLHEIIPSTKNISTEEPIVGRCNALTDSLFKFGKKTNTTYEADVHFECNFTFTQINFMNISITIKYEIAPLLRTNFIDFTIKSITGVPQFHMKEGYEIKNQTINMAQGSKVLGSGYKTAPRRYPNIQVRESYLFLYDSSAQPSLMGY